MDVTQMFTSAVVPGAPTLPASAESSSGASTASPLFREMFSKAALAAGATQSASSGSLQVNGTGASLAVQVLALSGGEALPEQGAQEMSGVPEGQLGTLIARAMAHRKTAGESALTPEQRGLSLHRGRENKGEVKTDLSERQLETELLAGSEILLIADVTTRENKAEGSDSDVTTQERPRQTSADGAGNPALAMLPAGLESVPVSMPVERNVSYIFAAERHGNAALPVLPETAAVVAQAVTKPVQGIFTTIPWQTSADSAENPALAMLPAGLESVPISMPVVRNLSHGFAAEKHGASTMPALPEPAAAVADGARQEQHPADLDVAAEQVVKHAGSAAGAVEKKAVSLVQPEITVLRSIPGKEGSIPAAGSEFSPLTAEVAGTAKTTGLEVSAVSPDLKKTAEVVQGGEKLVSKDHGKVTRHENGPVTKQVPHDQNPAGKGETVMRELPSGITVLNPAQTLTMGMGRPAFTADAAPLAVPETGRGRIIPQEGEAREEKGRQISPAGEGEKIARNAEGFSSQNNSNLGHDSTSQGGNHAVSQTAAASGSFDAVAKGQLEPLSEVPREHEVSELHQNILSQVREKLVSQDPSGTVSKISLKLNPHELGELQINIRLEDQKMKVDITAQNPVVKEALLQNIDQLKDTLMRQNISMERFHVSTGDGGQTSNQSFREGRQTAQQNQDTFRYPLSGYYQDDSQVGQVAYADARENTLVDMRF